MPVRAVLFDFDGTLADSFSAITSSTNHVREKYGLPPLTEAQVRESVGWGLAHLMATLIPHVSTEETVATYREHHPQVMLSGTRLCPGVAETLPELQRRGYRLAVCSNKAVSFTRDLVEHLGLTPLFSAVLGPDDVAGRAKPDPAMLLEGLTRLSVSAHEAIYVGDMVIDVRTAHAAGVPVWLVPGGASGWDEALAAHPTRILSGFSEMLDLLPGYERGEKGAGEDEA